MLQQVKQKTLEEIVLETVQAYSDPKNRALFKETVPRYGTDEGKFCAIGRCLNSLGIKKLKNRSTKFVSIVLNELGYQRKDLYLKQQYRGHELVFWDNLQELHDNDNHWSEDGITKVGLDFIFSKFGQRINKDELQAKPDCCSS